jgi:hypothetical protein
MLSMQLDPRRKIQNQREHYQMEQRLEQCQRVLGQRRLWQVWWQQEQREQKRHPLRRHRQQRMRQQLERVVKPLVMLV